MPNFEEERFAIKTCGELSRIGRRCVITPIVNSAPRKVQKLIEASFVIRGPMLFNSLPKALRNFNGTVAGFKHKLDSFLKGVPDKPAGFPQSAASNCIIDQLAQLRAEGNFLNT